MSDLVDLVDKFLTAYNDKDFDAMGRMMTSDIDMAHFNRGAAFKGRDELLAVFPAFANDLAPDRAFSPALRVIVSGNMVVRESDFTATPVVDIPGFAAKGEKLNLRLCSIFRFNDDGLIAEWKDHG